MSSVRALLIGAILLGSATEPALGQERGNPDWFVRLGGYFWLSNVDGSNTAAGVDVAVTDSVLEPSWAARLEVGRWRLRAIVDLSRANQVNPLVPKTAVDPRGSYDFTMTSLEVRAAAQIGGFSPRQAVEVFGGVRHVRQVQRLDLVGPSALTQSVTQFWTEPVFGSRYFAAVGRRFWFAMLVDVGGLGVGSDFTWVLDGELGFHLATPADVTLRYRYMESQYDNGKPGVDHYVWDRGQVQGWFLGLVFHR